MMRRNAAAITIVIVCTFAVMVLAGCGSDSATARGYIEKGDEVLEQAQSDTGELQSRLETLLNGIASDVESGQVPDSSAVSEDVKEIEELGEQLKEDGEKAREQYAKVEGLKGVDEYSEYATARIEMIDYFFQMVGATMVFLDDVAEAVAAGTLDADSLTALYEEYIGGMAVVSEKAQESEERAEKLKEDLDL